ncbi:MAG TPA: hypothetical protein VH062_12485 [Polyangiaceae bacterium]|jgi:hypothetical protein|nr:hypothetical protein [Polyangiaceae bacterium]
MSSFSNCFRVLVNPSMHGGIGGIALLAAALSGCAGATPQAEGPSAPGEVTHRDIRVSHQPCAVDSADAEKINVGGDARPDIVIVRSGGREVCRSVDMNFDGIVDTWIYRDSSGAVSRRENDYDRDGRIDEIAIYKGGVLVEKERATTLVGRLDTWHFYQGGKLARTERDSDGDTQIDQWWEYPKPDQPECPLIHSDVDGDGHPDPGATVNVCDQSSGYVPPERASDKPASGASFERSSPNDVPTEVEQKPADGTEGTKK